MSELHECLTVLCPFDQIRQAVAAYVGTLPQEEGHPVVAMRVPIGDLIVERRADLVLEYVRSHPGYEIFSLKWRPHDGGIYPVFRGTLSVEEGAGNFCRFDLDGAYEPPLGLAGAVLDNVVGHHLAETAARLLLDEIKTGVELAFQTGATVS